MNPSISIFRAHTAHFQLQVLLAAQMNTEIMGGFIEQSVIQRMTDVLHNEINLMRRTPDAHELGLTLVINSYYYTSVSPNHHVLAISAESNNFRSPMCIQRIQNAIDHGNNVLYCMTIVKRHCDQVQIL
jgi:hypothetical protein